MTTRKAPVSLIISCRTFPFENEPAHDQVLGCNISKHDQEPCEWDLSMKFVDCNQTVGSNKAKRSGKNETKTVNIHPVTPVECGQRHSDQGDGVSQDHRSHDPLELRIQHTINQHSIPQKWNQPQRISQ